MGHLTGPEILPGTKVAGYEVEALVGRGGMGAVYRASEEGLGRRVALKVIAPELAADERFRERFLRESKIAASLDHPHVVPIYGAGEQGGLLYLAMRYVEGSDLAALLSRQGALEPRRALELLSQVAEALDAAHEKGLVHRDVKPSNVLIAEAAGREHCYLGDFGLTKRTDSLSGVSVAGQVTGTLEYVAPEQITGEPLDERSDVYSLGCVLYESLTGQAPFPRATDVALLWAHVHEEPTPPSAVRPELPIELDPVLTRALAKDPARRYRSAGELIAATRSALRLVQPAPPTAPSRLRPLASLVLLLAAAALAASYLLTREEDGLSSVSPNSVGVIDPGSNRVVAEVAVGIDPEGIALDESTAWVANSTDGTISRINRSDRRIIQTLTLGDYQYPGDVGVGNGVLWVASTEAKVGYSGAGPFYAPSDRASHAQNGDYFVPKLDWFGQETTTRLGSAPIPGLICIRPGAMLAIGTSGVWFGCDTLLSRFVPGVQPNPVSGSPTVVQLSPSAVTPVYADAAFGLGSIWLVNRAANTVTEIDPVSRREIRQVAVGEGPSAVAVGWGSVWVANFDDDTLWRIGVPGRRQPVAIDTISVGDGPVDVAVGDDAVWVVNGSAGTVSRVDPERNDVVETIDVGNEPRRVAVAAGEVWVTVRGPVTLGSAEPGG